MTASGGKSPITAAVRRQIIDLYLQDPVAAQAMATSLGLRRDYAYRVTLEAGLLPRVHRNWPKHLRETT